MIERYLREGNLHLKTEFKKSLKDKTGYRTGGKAKFFIKPENEEDVTNAFRFAKNIGLEPIILGYASNVLISDKDLEAVVIDTSLLNKYNIDNEILVAECGLPTSEAAKMTAQKSLAGLENFYFMPGYIGGGLYMNSKCYGRAFSDIFISADCINIKSMKKEKIKIEDVKQEFGNKISPFQNSELFIYKVKLQLMPKNKSVLEDLMSSYKKDREKKHQFDYPSCGCVFKNDSSLGKSMGKVIEDLGLKKKRVGGAIVSPYHGNFIVNEKNATSQDIKDLIEQIKEIVLEKTGVSPEEEIIYFGDFNDKK